MKKKLFSFSFVIILLLSMMPNVFGASKVTIPQLQATIKKLNAQISDIKKVITTKDKTLSLKNKAISDKDKVIKNKDNEIQTLTQEIAELKEKFRIQREIDDKKKVMEKLTGTIYTDSNINKVYKESEGAIEWFEFNTEFATMYLTESALDNYAYIVLISDLVIKDEGKFFGTNGLPRKISVFISDREEITKTRGGDYFDSEKTIVIKASTDLVGVYSHELGHAFSDLTFDITKVRSNLQSSVHWLNEGTSEYVARYFMDYTKYNVPENHQFYRTNTNIEELRKLLSNFDRFNNEINFNTLNRLPDKYYGDYVFYESIIKYIEDNYEHQKLVNLYNDLKTQTIAESLQKEFGVSENVFMGNWREYYDLN